MEVRRTVAFFLLSCACFFIQRYHITKANHRSLVLDVRIPKVTLPSSKNIFKKCLDNPVYLSIISRAMKPILDSGTWGLWYSRLA